LAAASDLLNCAAVAARFFDGAVLSEECFVLRWVRGDHVLFLNPAATYGSMSLPSPDCPACDLAWRLVWSSEERTYGGAWTPPVENDLWRTWATRRS
jgi:hypothetical protein